MALTAGVIPVAVDGDTIQDGYSVVLTIGASGSDSAIPTEQAVREGLDEKQDLVGAATEDNWASFDANGQVQDSGLSQAAAFTWTGVHEFQNRFILDADITPTALSGHTHDWAPTDLASSSVIRASAGAAYNLTGLTGGTDGRVIALVNVGSYAITLKDEDGNSTAANRFALVADDAVGAGEGRMLMYDGTAERWRVVGNNPTVSVFTALSDTPSSFSGESLKLVRVNAGETALEFFAESAIDHDGLTNYVADEHVAHSGVTLTAGVGLSGGGDISANRSFAVDIDGLTVDGSPDGAADYVMTYDASAGGLKKVLLDNLPGGGAMQIIVFRPTQNEAPSANYATLDQITAATGIRPVLDFDGSTDETAIFSGVLSESYAGGGLSVQIFYAMDSANTGTKVCKWDVAIERIVDGDLLSSGGSDFADANSTEDTVDNTANNVDLAEVTFTNGADMDSLAAGEPFRLKVTRNNSTSGTNATGDAQLVFVVVSEA